MIICLTIAPTHARARDIYNQSDIIFELVPSQLPEANRSLQEEHADKIVQLKYMNSSWALQEYIRLRAMNTPWLAEGYHTQPEVLKELETVYSSLPKGILLTMYNHNALDYACPIEIILPIEQ